MPFGVPPGKPPGQPSAVGVRPSPEPGRTSGKIGWSDFRRGSSLPSAPSAAGTMFSKLKSGTSSVSQGAQVLATNNIINLFDVGKLVCSAGPELIWKVYEGFRKKDGKVSRALPAQTVYSERNRPDGPGPGVSLKPIRISIVFSYFFFFRLLCIVYFRRIFETKNYVSRFRPGNTVYWFLGCPSLPR